MDILWGLYQATCGPQHWGATNQLEKLSYSHKLFNVSSGFRVELQDLGGKHLKMQVSLELPFKEFLKNVRVNYGQVYMIYAAKERNSINL